MNNYKNKYSIIAEIFFGIIEKTNECINCKNLNNNSDSRICYNYELFHSLIFSLEEIRNWKNNNFYYLQNQNNINNVVSLFDCFEYNQKKEEIKALNTCFFCKQNSNTIFCSKIFYGPNVLVLILNRGNNNINNVKLDFQENIDLSNYIFDKELNSMIYNLYGVISYSGGNESSTKFVASCKSPINNIWYKFNDSLVTQIFNFKNDVLNFGIPYILFYKKQIYNKNLFNKY